MTPAASSLPSVSIIMPTYNRVQYIRQAIESVRAQDYPDWELIVVDDGSTDATPSAVAEFASSNICYLRQDRQGPAAARNAGIAKARGALIAFLDSDDYFLPGKLIAQASLLAADSGLGAVHSGWQRVDEEGNPLQTVAPWKDAPTLDLKAWLMWKPVFLGGILIRSAWLRKVGRFNPRLFQTDDVEMMFRLAAAGCRMRWLRQSTVCYRQHPASITRDAAQQAGDLLAAVDSFFSSGTFSNQVRKLEPYVRHYTLLWIAFDLWRKDCTALMQEYLHKTLPFTKQESDQIPVVWQSQLIQRALEYGIAWEKTASLGEILCRIPLPGNPDPERIRGILQWLHMLWWEYQQGRRPEPEQMRALSSGMSPRAIAKGLQSALLGAPDPNSLVTIDAIWRDLLTTGVVPRSNRGEVTTLYLTVFSQSVFRRDARSAAAAAFRAIRHGASFSALPAWGRFLRAAAGYVFSPKEQKTNRIAAAKRRIQ